MKRGQTQSRRFGVAVTISAERRGHLQRRSGAVAIKPGISFVLRQLLVGRRAPRPQLVAQFARVLRTLFTKISHLRKKEKTRESHNPY